MTELSDQYLRLVAMSDRVDARIARELIAARERIAELEESIFLQLWSAHATMARSYRLGAVDMQVRAAEVVERLTRPDPTQAQWDEAEHARDRALDDAADAIRGLQLERPVEHQPVMSVAVPDEVHERGWQWRPTDADTAEERKDG